MSTAAVKVTVTIAQPFVIAGTPFTLTTTFENMHDEKIEIIESKFHIPYQVQWIDESEYKTAYENCTKNRFLRLICRNSILKAALKPPGFTKDLNETTKKKPTEDGSFSTPHEPLAKGKVFEVLPSESVCDSFMAIVPNWLFTSGGELAFPGLINYRYKGEVIPRLLKFDLHFDLRCYPTV